MKLHQRTPTFVLSFLVTCCLTFVFASSACSVTPESLTPEQRTEKEQLDANTATAQTPAEKAAADKAEQAFEARILQERAGPIVAALSTVHPVVAALSPLLLAAVPLLGKRGRKLAKTGATAAVEAINPFSRSSPDMASKGQALATVVNSALAYLGVSHSTPKGEAALHGAPPGTTFSTTIKVGEASLTKESTTAANGGSSGVSAAGSPA